MKTNRYGNLEKLPKNWVITPATVSQLRNLKVKTHKLMNGWKGSGRYINPDIVNIIPEVKKDLVEKYLEDKRNKKRGNNE